MESVAAVGGTAEAGRSRLARVAASPWFAYGSVFLIQSKVLWGIWAHRDLTSADTATYFTRATDWSTHFHLNPVWSPLDSVVWGSMQWFIPDAYASEITYRILTALAVSLLVLAILRRLLSPGFAWALAVWWAILPVNFDELFEIHLFSLLPGLIAVVLALSMSGLRMRATVFGVLVADALLVRNEITIAALVWLAVWLLYEWRRGPVQRVPVRSLIRALAIPLAVVVVIEGAVVLSSPQLGSLRAASDAKHANNVCQIYAFGYQQRHDDFAGSPWTDCDRLMQRDFGRPRPTLTEAIAANPGAMAQHFVWNVRLTPAVLQLLLFDRTSLGARHNPDYIPVKTGSTFALIGSIAVLAFCAGGLALLWRSRRRWWERWIARRGWGWAALGALALSDLLVMVVARPRPEFIFGFTVFMLAVIGMAAMAYVDRWPSLGRLGAATPVLAVAVLLGVPSHYGSGYRTPNAFRPGQPLEQVVDRLEPYSAELRGDEVGLLATYGDDACHYVGREDPCLGVYWPDIWNRSAGTSAAQALNAHGVDFIYVDGEDMRNPDVRKVVNGLQAARWQRIGPPLAQGWTFFRRASMTVPRANSTSNAT